MTAVDPQAPVFAQVPVTAEGVDGADRSDVRPGSAPTSFGDVVRAYDAKGPTTDRVVKDIRELRRVGTRAGLLSALLFPSGEVCSVLTIA